MWLAVVCILCYCNAAAYALLLPFQEAETRAARADTLLPRLEDRRIALEQDRKAQADKAARLAGA